MFGDSAAKTSRACPDIVRGERENQQFSRECHDNGSTAKNELELPRYTRLSCLSDGRERAEESHLSSEVGMTQDGEEATGHELIRLSDLERSDKLSVNLVYTEPGKRVVGKMTS
jgi:hypothetical protein